jgi:hypothetical protein
MHARWASMLQEYDITFVPRKGVKHLDADGLSRNPLPTDEDKTFARMDHCAPKPGFHPVATGLAMLAASAAGTSHPPQHKSEEPGESHPVDSQDRDTWQESAVMEYRETGRRHRLDATPKERDRIWHRAREYQFENGVLYKRTSKSIEKVVPRPEHRANLIRRVHQDVGHYGVKKTYSLLEPTYWWIGMFGPSLARGCRLHSVRPSQG